jgi:hypothetical protein
LELRGIEEYIEAGKVFQAEGTAHTKSWKHKTTLFWEVGSVWLNCKE